MTTDRRAPPRARAQEVVVTTPGGSPVDHVRYLDDLVEAVAQATVGFIVDCRRPHRVWERREIARLMLQATKGSADDDPESPYAILRAVLRGG